MEEEKYQKELFEFKKPKKAFPRFASIFAKTDFDRPNVVVTLTLDKVILAAIGIVMLLILVYALGVEVGKSRVRRAQAPALQVGVSSAKTLQTQTSVAPRAISADPSSSSMTRAIAQQGSSAAAVSSQGPVRPTSSKPESRRQDAAKTYTIIAGAYRNKDSASAEAGRLKKEGLDAFVAQSGDYFQVCVGMYPNNETAQRALGAVRKTCGDAYVKLRY